ncbi:MAG: phosphoribosylglycinamide formyltransferase [Planctomycetes bacterium]|nr:phosphoribosylglycinamide formyltransferase [Planctomycetota bacterium]
MLNRVIAYTDGGSRGNPGPAGAGIVLRDPHHNILMAKGFYLGHLTNNGAEYAGVIKALEMAVNLGARIIEVFCDSELLVKQINGLYRVRCVTIRPLYEQVVALLNRFDQWKVTHVYRKDNTHADAMVNAALDAKTDVTESPACSAPTTDAPKLRLGALISGGGRTILNILDRINLGQIHAEIPLVISSQPDISGVQRMQDAGLTVKVVRKKDYANIQMFSQAIEDALAEARVELVIQGGWLCLWKIPKRYDNCVMNIHPALLPSFGGQGMWGHHVHEAVLKTGCKVSGCTVHFCTDEYDSGPIVVQRTCPVYSSDTADTLAERVFEQECLAFPEAIKLFSENKITVEDRIARIE